MQFLLNDDVQPGIAAVTERLQQELSQGRKVLWLVCGGSSIPAIVTIMRSLDAAATASLTVLLTDERYGPVGHPDSNASQLLAAGFEPQKATVLPVLLPDMPLEPTRRHYDAIAQQAYREAEMIIGLFGIGPDGHIAGILPGSSAVGSPDFVAAYEAAPFTRLTLTFHALKRLNVAYAFVFGEAKRQALEQLHDQTLPYDTEPSQILKELPEAYVYNDQIGDTL